MIHPEYDENWSEEVNALYQHDMEQYWDPSISTYQWNQYKNLLDTYLSRVDDNTQLTILDVGCAQATLAMTLAERGHSVVACDIRQTSLDYAASRYERGDISFLRGNVLEMELDQKFDLIFANQIIEHLVYPLDMVNRLKNLLNESGRLIVTTPNWGYIKNSLPSFAELGAPDEWQHKQFTADGSGHFFAYKKAELVDIFQQAGLNSIETMSYETPIIAGHLKCRYLHRILPYSFLKALDKALLRLPWINHYLSHQQMIIGTK